MPERFHEDAFRDAVGLGKALRRAIAPKVAAPYAKALDKAHRQTEKIVKSAGLLPGDSGYKNVLDAATHLGKKDYFVGTNQMFSKFAHPTAMMVVAMPGNKVERVFRMVMLQQGVLAAVECLQNIHSVLVRHGYTLDSADFHTEFFRHW